MLVLIPTMVCYFYTGSILTRMWWRLGGGQTPNLSATQLELKQMVGAGVFQCSQGRASIAEAQNDGVSNSEHVDSLSQTVGER